MTNSLVSSSRTTAAVRPAADDAFPLVYTARGENSSIFLFNHVKIQTLLQLNSRLQISKLQKKLKLVHVISTVKLISLHTLKSFTETFSLNLLSMKKLAQKHLQKNQLRFYSNQ